MERVNSVPVRDEELTIPLMSDATSSDELKPDDGKIFSKFNSLVNHLTFFHWKGDEEAERKGSDQETDGDEGKAEEETEGVYESLQEYLAFVEDAVSSVTPDEEDFEHGKIFANLKSSVTPHLSLNRKRIWKNLKRNKNLVMQKMTQEKPLKKLNPILEKKERRRRLGMRRVNGNNT